MLILIVGTIIDTPILGRCCVRAWIFPSTLRAGGS